MAQSLEPTLDLAFAPAAAASTLRDHMTLDLINVALLILRVAALLVLLSPVLAITILLV